MTDDQGQTSPTPASPDSPQPATEGTFPTSEPPASPYGQPQQPPAPYGQPTSPYGQQPPAPVAYQQPGAPQKSGKAIGALVCGILAILFAWVPLFGVILGVVAIVLAVKAVKEAGKDGKATGGKVCGIIGIVLSVITFILYFVLGIAALSYVAIQPYSGTMTDDSSGIIGELTKSDAEKQAEAAAVAELDKLKNGDDEIVQYIAANVDESFSTGSGYSLTELGVAPTDLADWMLSGLDYKIDGTSVYESDGTGTVYADVTMRDVYALADTYYTDVQAYANSADVSTLDEATVKAKLGELLKAAMNKTTGTTTNYAGVDVVKSGNTWIVDGESWSGEVDYLFGLY